MNARARKRTTAPPHVAGLETDILDAVADPEPARALVPYVPPAPSVALAVESAAALIRAAVEAAKQAEIATLTRERDEQRARADANAAELDTLDGKVAELEDGQDETANELAALRRLAETVFDLFDELDAPMPCASAPLYPVRDALRALPHPRAARVAWSMD